MQLRVSQNSSTEDHEAHPGLHRSILLEQNHAIFTIPSSATATYTIAAAKVATSGHAPLDRALIVNIATAADSSLESNLIMTALHCLCPELHVAQVAPHICLWQAWKIGIPDNLLVHLTAGYMQTFHRICSVSHAGCLVKDIDCAGASCNSDCLSQRP